MNKTKGSN